MNDRFDSMLVLFPGSEQSDEAVSILSEIGIYDAFMIRSRLRCRLPAVFCPCRRRDIAGETGRRLSKAGIRFMAVAKDFLESPFSIFDAARCRFDAEMIRLWDAEGKERAIFEREKCLLLEAVYESQTRKRTEKTRRKRPSEAGPRLDVDPGRDTGAGSGERAGVLLLLGETGSPALRFMEEEIDFSFLGDRRALTAAENFGRLREKLDRRFGPVCRDMVTFAFGLEALTEDRTEDRGARGSRLVRMRSNVSSVHTMARLLFCMWRQAQGKADRVFPP